MNEQLSALVDGELPKDQCEQLLADTRMENSLREAWTAYHLIGDVMRGTLPIGLDRERFERRLMREPAIVAPQVRREPHRERWVWSAAAGVAAVAFVGVVALPSLTSRTSFEPPTPVNVVSAPVSDPTPEPLVSAALPVATAVPRAKDVEDYLIAHQRFSPTFIIQGAVPYVRVVGEEARERNR